MLHIYTRVSTSMQEDSYSLDVQKDKLEKYAEFQGMVVVGEYSDEGKSGKNIEGRPHSLIVACSLRLAATLASVAMLLS